MENRALVVIDLQNDITPNYKEIIENVNSAIHWAIGEGIPVVYIKHHFPLPIPRTFKPDTPGAEFVPELHVVSRNIFTKTRGNALTSPEFSRFISENAVHAFYITGADATACVKSTCRGMVKMGYTVHVLSDCVTSSNQRKLPQMLQYYTHKGCFVEKLTDLQNTHS